MGKYFKAQEQINEINTHIIVVIKAKYPYVDFWNGTISI